MNQLGRQAENPNSHEREEIEEKVMTFKLQVRNRARNSKSLGEVMLENKELRRTWVQKAPDFRLLCPGARTCRRDMLLDREI